LPKAIPFPRASLDCDLPVYPFHIVEFPGTHNHVQILLVEIRSLELFAKILSISSSPVGLQV
jgi:hypothetical protein